MEISVGSRLPDATLLRVKPDGHEPVTVADYFGGRRVVVFAVPGAFTPTCDSAHLPSFIRTKPQFDAKGIDEVACLATNDVHVMRAWGKASGAYDAGIGMLSDPGAAFSKAIGMAFSVPGAAMMDRSKRYAMLVEDGVVTVWHPEPGVGCAISGGEAMLEDIG